MGQITRRSGTRGKADILDRRSTRVNDAAGSGGVAGMAETGVCGSVSRRVEAGKGDLVFPEWCEFFLLCSSSPAWVTWLVVDRTGAC